jgi:acylphosphatase
MTRELREVWFSGHVQGVGFRYTTCALARRTGVGGYVRNLPDGRVHLVVEGDVDEVESLLAAVQDRLGPYIREKREDRRPATGQFRQFDIRT